MSKYGDGSLITIKASPGYFYATFPLGEGKRSPKFRCKNQKEGRRLFESWQTDQEKQAEIQAIEDSRGAKEQRTVKFYLKNHWDTVQHNLASTTRALNQSTLDVHIFKDEQFCESDYYSVTSEDVQNFLGRLKASDNTKKRVYTFLRWSFQAAVEERLLPLNPIHIAKNKLPKTKKSNVVSFTPEHESQLLRFTSTNAFWGPLVIFALDTGCRMSEILGLQWDMVNLERREVKIHRSLNTVGTEVILKDAVKTDSSRRILQVSKTTLNCLKALTGNSRPQDGYVFPSPEGTGWNRHRFTHLWTSLLKKAGVPHYGFHSTRHTCATRLLRSGAYLTAVSQRLGHSKPSMTLDLYSDAIPTDQHTLANAFDAMVETVLKQTTVTQLGTANLSQHLSQAAV